VRQVTLCRAAWRKVEYPLICRNSATPSSVDSGIVAAEAVVERINTLEEWGWSEFFADQLSAEEKTSWAPARVVEPSRGLSRAVCSGGFIWVEHADGIAPAVGDWVVGPLRDHGAGEKRLSIERILERRNKLSRQAPGGQGYEQVLCANVDTLFIVVAVSQFLHLPGVQKALDVAQEAGIQAVVVVTKADAGVEIEECCQQLRSVSQEVEIFPISVKQDLGLQPLGKYFEGGATVVLLGASGAGKSTLTNYLLSTEVQDVGDVRESDQKGRHTTTGRRLHYLGKGGMVIDSPGIREIQKWVDPDTAPAAPKKTKIKSKKNSRSRRSSQEED
jgi:ribosome biogenesis GTPase